MHNIENVEKIWVDASKTFFNTGLSQYFLADDPTYSVGLSYVDADHIMITTNLDRSWMDLYITLNYTKTTDTATITPNIPTLTAD